MYEVKFERYTGGYEAPQGWEPFAITAEDDGVYVWLRRIKPLA